MVFGMLIFRAVVQLPFAELVLLVDVYVIAVDFLLVVRAKQVLGFLKQKYVATLYFQYGDKAAVQLPYQSPESLRLIYQTINMNYKRVAGINLYVPFNVSYMCLREVPSMMGRCGLC